MVGYRIVDLRLPLMNGGGFGMPAEITYLDHRTPEIKETRTDV